MKPILQSLLALISLLLLAWIATTVKGAAWETATPDWQGPPATPSLYPQERQPSAHGCLHPAPQPATYLHGQPFAYGYFGARARPAAAYQRNYRNDWHQWTIIRAD